MSEMEWPFYLSALAAGGLWGYVTQRGGFCLVRALSNMVLMGDATILRAYALALLVAMVRHPGARVRGGDLEGQSAGRAAAPQVALARHRRGRGSPHRGRLVGLEPRRTARRAHLRRQYRRDPHLPARGLPQPRELEHGHARRLARWGVHPRPELGRAQLVGRAPPH